MRRQLLVAVLALVATPAAAGAQFENPRFQDPHAPISDLRNAHTFAVSAHGVQRYEGHSVTRERPGPGPFDDRGTVDSRTRVAFRTQRPVRVTISTGHGETRVRWHALAHGAEVPVVARFGHSGAERMESTGFTDDVWQPMPPADERNCSRTIDGIGFDLRLAKHRISALPAGEMFASVSDPFRGCPWGDPAVALYPAQGRLALARLLRSRRTRVVLRGRDTDRFASDRTTSTWSKTTTVRLTFRKVR